MSNDTWRKIINHAYGSGVAESLEFMPKIDLDREFNSGYGGSEGHAFVAYDIGWVYFTVVYDGAEWVGRVPRNPDIEFKPEHFGSE